jgi:sterol-4alpha-carboxylate 3-dehydrogenase (decarboxylating)
LTDWTYVTNVADTHLLAADKLTENRSPPVAGEIFFITNDDPYPFWTYTNGILDRLDKCHPGKRSGKKPIVIPRIIGLFIAGCFELTYWLLRRKDKPVFTRYIVTFMCTARWYNIEKAKNTLGYKPLVGMEEGLERTVEVSELSCLMII